MSERGYKIDLFQPGDAAGVARLFKEVYGDGYPVKIVYNPEQLVTGFESGEYIPILARTPDDRIVGYTSLYRSAPHTGLYEAGQTLVLPDYRRTPVAGLLFRYIMRVAPTISGLDALFCEGVCNHTHVQRAGIMFKHVETAIEIDLMPAEAYEREQTASGRVSTVDMFRTFVQKPHAVYVPEVYEDCSRFVLKGLDDSRMVVASTAGLPSDKPTEIATRIFGFAQLARTTVYEVGADFEAAFDAEEKRIADEYCTVIQVWLKLSWPWIGAVVDVLRNRGFFLGGILPRWFGKDGFLMQKVLAQPNWEGISLHTDRAKQILRFIKNDWERTQGEVI
ncbi:MAG: hypothetical protein A4E58_01919 [Syntrophorhabdus sp. PtaB.Bin006]|nr:MAG: hypothetical protein A4E58_01919 [Syntrophorhabdus sp. PtaB.Bin006]